MIEKLKAAMGLDLTPAAAKAALTGKQLARGRTKSRVDQLRADLDAAENAFAEEERIQGEREVEGLDVNLNKLNPLKERCEQVRRGLNVAIQKDEAAQRDLHNAEQLASVSSEVFDIGVLKYTVMPKLDNLLTEMERLLREEVGPALDAARVSATVDTAWITAVQLALKAHVRRASAVLSPGVRGFDAYLGTKTLADRVIDPAFVKARRNAAPKHAPTHSQVVKFSDRTSG